MIVSKTPLRMSFVGGGTDLPAFYLEEVGAVLSTSIDKYMYIAVNRKFDGRIRLSYSRTEEVDRREELDHPLVREALAMTGVEGGIEIGVHGRYPFKGVRSGLIERLYRRPLERALCLSAALCVEGDAGTSGL